MKRSCTVLLLTAVFTKRMSQQKKGQAQTRAALNSALQSFAKCSGCKDQAGVFLKHLSTLLGFEIQVCPAPLVQDHRPRKDHAYCSGCALYFNADGDKFIVHSEDPNVLVKLEENKETKGNHFFVPEQDIDENEGGGRVSFDIKYLVCPRTTHRSCVCVCHECLEVWQSAYANFFSGNSAASSADAPADGDDPDQTEDDTRGSSSSSSSSAAAAAAAPVTESKQDTAPSVAISIAPAAAAAAAAVPVVIPAASPAAAQTAPLPSPAQEVQEPQEEVHINKVRSKYKRKAGESPSSSPSSPPANASTAQPTDSPDEKESEADESANKKRKAHVESNKHAYCFGCDTYFGAGGGMFKEKKTKGDLTKLQVRDRGERGIQFHLKLDSVTNLFVWTACPVATAKGKEGGLCTCKNCQTISDKFKKDYQSKLKKDAQDKKKEQNKKETDQPSNDSAGASAKPSSKVIVLSSDSDSETPVAAAEAPASSAHASETRVSLAEGPETEDEDGDSDTKITREEYD